MASFLDLLRTLGSGYVAIDDLIQLTAEETVEVAIQEG